MEDSIIAWSGRPTRMEEATLPRGHPENPFASDWRYVPVPGARTKCEITRPRVLGRIRKCTRIRLTAQRSFSKAYISIKGQLTWIFVCMVAEPRNRVPANNALHWSSTSLKPLIYRSTLSALILSSLLSFHRGTRRKGEEGQLLSPTGHNLFV